MESSGSDERIQFLQARIDDLVAENERLKQQDLQREVEDLRGINSLLEKQILDILNEQAGAPGDVQPSGVDSTPLPPAQPQGASEGKEEHSLLKEQLELKEKHIEELETLLGVMTEQSQQQQSAMKETENALERALTAQQEIQLRQNQLVLSQGTTQNLQERATKMELQLKHFIRLSYVQQATLKHWRERHQIQEELIAKYESQINQLTSKLSASKTGPNSTIRMPESAAQ